MAAERPLLVLVYQRPSLPWMFDSAHNAGVDLVLVHRPNPLPDERLPDRLPPAIVATLPLDVFGDPDNAIAALAAFHVRRPLAGITTCFDGAVQFVARAARELSLLGLSEDAALAVRDKRYMRSRLRSAGLNTPGFVTLDRPEQWEKATGLDFPVVIKPAGGYASLGVTRADTPEELSERVQLVWDVCRTQLGYGDRSVEFEGIVIEEYLDGAEFAVESLAYRGEVRVHTIGYKGNPTGPYFEESVYRAPAHLAPALEAAIVREVTAAHAALGVTDGATHTELRLRAGTPYLLEMGARVGGSGISHFIVETVTGVDFAAEAIRIAVGQRPVGWDDTLEHRSFAGNYAIPIGGSGRIVAMHGFDEVRADPASDLVVRALSPGDVVLPYPNWSGYPGFVLSHHDSYADAERFHSYLDKTISIDYEPVD